MYVLRNAHRTYRNLGSAEGEGTLAALVARKSFFLDDPQVRCYGLLGMNRKD